LYTRLAEVSGREVDEIRRDARQGRLLTAEEALAYGLVHDIVSSMPPWR
jgi:ATP-dependent Clp protease, protease subunit